jgi:hypothetical protein
MRKSLIGFGVVGGLAATVTIVPYFLDWNWFKPQLVEAVETATGYDVDVAGDIGFSLLPGPRLSAERLTVRGFGPAREPLVTARKLSAAVAFLPLLSRRAEVRYIALEQPVVRIVSYVDGTGNWRDPAAADRSDGGGSLSIEDFRIEDGTFISAGPDGESVRIDDIDLAIAVKSSDGPYSAKGSLRYGALPVRLTAGMKPGGGLRVEADLADAAHFDFTGQIGEAPDGGAMPVSGRLALRGERLGALLAAIDGDDEADAAAYRQPFNIAARIDGNSRRLRVAALTGKLAGSELAGDLDVTRGKRTTVAGRISLARVDVADWRSDADRPDSEPFELPKTVDADVLLRIVDLGYGDMRFGIVNAPLTLAEGVAKLGRTRIALDGGVASVSGTLDAAAGKPRFSGRFEATLPRPAQTLTAMGIDRYAVLPPLRLAGGIGVANDVAVLANLAGQLDGKPLSGRLRYPLDEAAQISVDLAVQSVDLDRLVARPSTPREGEATARAVAFDVRLGQLQSGGTPYRGVRAVGRYADDRVAVGAASVADAFGLALRAKGSVDRISGERRTDLAISLAGEGASGAITVKGPVARMEVDGAVTYAGAQIGLGGWIRTEPETGYQLTAKVTAAEAGAVLARLRESPRTARLGPLDLSMRIDGAGDRVRIGGIGGKIGTMTLAGDASVDTAGPQPFVNATLRAGVVPLLALMGDDGTGAEEAARGGARWSSDELSFDWIQRFDGRIALTAERAVYDSYVVERPSLILVNRGDTLGIETLKGTMFGGALSATGAVKAGGRQGLALDIALNDVPVEPLLEASMASAPATGMLDLTATVTASGRSQKALMSSLAGPVRIAATNGVIRKVDLKRLDEELGDLRSVNSLVRFAGGALRGGETRYRTLAVHATGRGGRFTIGRMDSDMDGGSMSAAGYVDLGQWYADATASFRLGSHADAPAIPATIRGPLPVPTVNYNLAPLSAWFGKRLLLVGINAATGKDKLDLGGLLGVGTQAADGAPATAGPTQQQPSGTAPAPRRTVEEELGGALAKGIGSLFGRKKPPPPAEPADDSAPEPVDLGGPN